MKRLASLTNKRGFTLIELIIVIAILGIIALIAIPNLSGIRQRSQVSADKRTAEQIGKAVRIWATDVDAGVRSIPDGAVGATDADTAANDALAAAIYTTLTDLCNTYISDGYTAKSFGSTPGAYYVIAQGAGTNNADQKILIWIDDASDPTLAAANFDGDSGTAGIQLTLGQDDMTYSGGAAGWAYLEQ